MLRTNPPSAAPFTFGSTAFLDLDGESFDAPWTDTLAVAWEALGRANQFVGSFFAAAFTVLEGAHLLDTMLCYGRLTDPSGKTVPGDLVCFAETRAARLFDGDWAISTGNGTVLAATQDGTWESRPHPRHVSAVWRPTTRPVLDPYSSIGRFYGPGAHRFREALSAPSLSIPGHDDVLALCVAHTRLPAKVREFCEWAEPHLIATPADLPAGALAFHPGHGRIGLATGGGRVLATDRRDNLRWNLLTPSRANLPRTWIPHL